MNKLIKFGAIPLLLFSFVVQFETSAQIHDIKKKSSNNKSSKSSSSSSSSSSSDNDATSDCVSGCVTGIFSSLFEGCLTSIFSGKDDDDDDYYTNNNTDNSFEDDYLYEESTTTIIKENKVELTDSVADKKLPGIDENKKIEPTKVIENSYEFTYDPRIERFDRKKDFSLEIKPLFDLGFHKGIDKNYTYVDYLPGARANIHAFIIDFRYNILTEYTDDFPDSFKSWELLFMLNLTANQDFKIILGTGIHREIWDEDPISFQEWYLGTKIPFANGADYFDADTRFSVDYETEAFPFFEIGARYNKRFLDFEHLAGYITLGVNYQNYYQSHDILALRGGIIIKIK